MSRYTLIQSGDFNAAENIGALAGDIKRSGIVEGLSVTAFDPAVPEVTVSAGKTVHIVASQIAEATLDDGTTVAEQRDQVQLVAHIDSQTVTLTDGAVNELFLQPNPAIDDSAAVVATTAGSPPTSDSVKIAEVDTDTDTVRDQWNLILPDGSLSYPDVDAVNATIPSLPNGISVIDRETDTQVVTGRLAADSILVDGEALKDSTASIRESVNQLFIDNARQDFELGLSLLELSEGQFEIYAVGDDIAAQNNVIVSLGSPLNGNGIVELDPAATDGFTEHSEEDLELVPSSVVVTDDAETVPTNGTIKYEIEDENGNIVTVPRTRLNETVDVSGSLETFGVRTRAILQRDSTNDTIPVLDAYSVYVDGSKPSAYLDASLGTVEEV
jgi:hypothetical protein